MRLSATLRALALGVALGLPALAAAQAPTMTVSADITTNTTWATGQVVLIDGIIYVRPGATLTIQPGVIIKGKATPSPSTGDLASALVVMIDAQIEAAGQPNSPIIFTAENDNVADPNDLDETFRNQWGGVMILGRATNNRGIQNAEGIPVSNDTRYGCDGVTFVCDENDDSGTLSYVSIRHAGFGLLPNSEINGLTLNSVGRGTDIHHIEVYANSDDSVEFFGGNVDIKYFASSFSGDDDLDWDYGYTGRIQFFFSVKASTGETGRCFESDGAASPFTATPLSEPLLSNVTCIGAGVAGTPGGSEAGNPALIFRDNTRGRLYNSVFTDFNNAGITIEDVAASTTDSRQQFADGNLVIQNNLFFGFGAGADFPAIITGTDATLEAAIAGVNTFANPQLMAIGRDQNNVLDPRPNPAGPAATGADFTPGPLASNSAFFTPTTYRGAFAPGAVSWLQGTWSVLVTNEYLSGTAVPAEAAPVAGGFGFSAVRPNPATDAATVRFALDRAQTVRLALYDVTGREVAVLADGALTAGSQEATVATAGLAPGVYVLRLTGETAVATRRLTVAH